MPRFLRLQVNVPRDTLIPADAAVMTWHFRTNEVGTVEQEAQDIVTKMIVFYDAVDVYFSLNVGTLWHYSTYDLEQPEPRVPIYEADVTHVPGTTALPAEAAICLSMQALPVSGLNQRRRRGRVFLGPLTVATGANANGDMRPDPAVRTAIVTAAGALTPNFVGATSGSEIEPCVFSRATFAVSGALIDAFVPVEQWYVDDAYDTQRRRGPAPTTRTVLTDV